MNAIRMHATGGPEVMRLEELPAPTPGPGQVLFRVEAAGVNFIEIYQRTGLYKLSLPTIPGSEAAGVVTAVGPGVSGLRPGDRIATVNALGAYAEQALVAAERAVKLPDVLSTRDGAAVMLQGMTAHYLACSTRPLHRGDTCLVHAAAGGAGLLLVQVAVLRGARVIGTASTRDKAERARAAGADEVILYTEQDFVAEVKRLTGGAGVQVVYDSVGVKTFDGSLACLAPRGLLALFGQSSGPVPPVDPQVLNRLGSLFLTRPTLGHYIATRHELLERANEVLAWASDGRLKLSVWREYPLAMAADAHRDLESRATSGKLLLVP